MDDQSFSIVRDPSKCILCSRCVAACNNQEIGVLSFINRGFNIKVGPAFDVSMAKAPCVYCGQCIIACPVGVLYEKEITDEIWEAINDPSKHVVMQVAPAVRAAIGEEFGFPIGTRTTGKLFAAMRRLGANRIFDTNFAADLTIIEEGNELIQRIKEKGIFAATGGIMETAFRTVADLLEEKNLPVVELTELRGIQGVKEVSLILGGIPMRIAVAHSTSAAKRLLDAIKNKTAPEFTFIKIIRLLK